MTLGDGIRNAITSVINRIGSSVVITPYTQSSDDSGYSGQVETDGESVNEIVIPYAEFKNIVKQNFGDIEVGGLQLAVKYTAVFEISGTPKYKMTYNSEVYDITKVQRYIINDTLLAWILTISKRFD